MAKNKAFFSAALMALVSLSVLAVAAETITIDIRPASDENQLNLNSNGLLNVLVETTDTFDVTEIDVSTVELAADGEGVPVATYVYADHDKDGDLDLLARFSIRDLKDNGLDMETTELTLTATLNDGTEIQGTDGVIPV